MNIDLAKFITLHNLRCRHGFLSNELKVKTPFLDIEKLYKLSPEIFQKKPIEFNNNIIDLKSKIINLNK